MEQCYVTLMRSEKLRRVPRNTAVAPTTQLNAYWADWKRSHAGAYCAKSTGVLASTALVAASAVVEPKLSAQAHDSSVTDGSAVSTAEDMTRSVNVFL